MIIDRSGPFRNSFVFIRSYFVFDFKT